MESWRPEHQIGDPMTLAEVEVKEPASRRRGRRICPMCELRCRTNEWPQLTEAGRAANPNYCIHTQ
eukprot:6094876-Prorocentrum_lima.AAC.1